MEAEGDCSGAGKDEETVTGWGGAERLCGAGDGDR